MARVPTRAPTVSLVTQVPALDPGEGQDHFLHRLAAETDPSDVHTDLDKGVTTFIVIDCRTPEKYAAAHIPGALNLPYRLISEASTAHLPKDKLLVLYCTSIHCNASTKSALQLSSLGFKVKEMLGGIEGWQHEGYAVETGLPRLKATATA